MNSWNINAKGDKEPLTKANLEEKKKDLHELLKFVRHLKFPNGKLVSSSQRKTCIIGFTATIHSTIALASELLNTEDGPDCIKTRHMQQDPLEHFFGMIRLRCGLNNNPNAIQFKGILRKLLVIKNGGVTPSLSSNCSILSLILNLMKILFRSTVKSC